MEKKEIKQTKELKVLICQISPIFKQKQKNLDRVKISLEKYTHKDKIDLVMFPELAFTGYNFKNKNHIFEQTEELGKGPSFDLCIQTAKRLNSYVIFGYPQKKKIQSSKQNDQINQYKLYNSACFINRVGEIISNAHKSHLYQSDELWSEQGEGFKQVIIQNSKNQTFKCTIGICMDINPYKWVSGKHELAQFAIKNKSQVILFLSAWNDHQPNHPNQHKAQLSIIEYWLSRLRPLLSTKTDPKPTMLFLCCDRAGKQTIYTSKKEQQTTFIGTSCAVKINPNDLIQKLDKKHQAYLMVETYL